MILIDMQMPDDCSLCRFKQSLSDYDTVCCADEENRDCNFYERPDWCPLQEIHCKAWEKENANE